MTKEIYLAGGCFWGTQAFLDRLDGVLETEAGYANGPTAKPSYRDVCGGSGHAETVRVVYDNSRISTYDLVNLFFSTIDPLSYHRQGMDMGIQYRTGIYYSDYEDLPELEKIYKDKQAEYRRKMEVELLPLENFCPAEEYHQKYMERNAGVQW